jgi:ATF/CREB family transcription factor
MGFYYDEIAALKCRQRKKAWLNELQTKVEGLQMENERLQQTIAGLHDEVGRLSGMLMQHRDCGLVGQYGRPIR